MNFDDITAIIVTLVLCVALLFLPTLLYCLQSAINALYQFNQRIIDRMENKKTEKAIEKILREKADHTHAS